MPHLAPALLLLLATGAPPPATDGVAVWRRPATGAKPAPVVVGWSSLKLEERTTRDVQLGVERSYRGVTLKALLLAAAQRTPSEDTALLHFKNGMVVPVPLDEATLGRLDLFVARVVKDGTGAFVERFDNVVHERSPWMEQRAITFGTNKLVAKDAFHPGLAAGTTKFTPWAHVDTLTGVELVNAAALNQTMRVSSDARVLQGLGVFEQRCQYCHGVRGTGASFGWDFVKPIPVHTWRDAESLLYHVKFRKLAGAEQGLLMPPQPDTTIDEVRALWEWMKAVSANELRPYAP
ncbi:MAG: cytochrome c [Deltaproteobacteria bacterium]|nr:cytochrome c [Deltaproteobacteria bacterium]